MSHEEVVSGLYLKKHCLKLLLSRVIFDLDWLTRRSLWRRFLLLYKWILLQKGEIVDHQRLGFFVSLTFDHTFHHAGLVPYLSDSDLNDAVLALRLDAVDSPFFDDIESVAIGDFTSSIDAHHLDASVCVLYHPIRFERWSLLDKRAIDCEDGFDGSHFDHWLIIISTLIRPRRFFPR